MKNAKASALGIALGMTALFSGLGLGALNYSGMQGQSSINQTLSTQAFWLADAGLERARELVQAFTAQTVYPATLPVDNNFATGTYSCTVTIPPGKSWSATSMGTPASAPLIKRNLYARIGYQGLDSALATTGTVTQNGNPTIGTISHVPPDASAFQTIFGMTMSEAQTTAINSSTYYDCTTNANVCGNNNNNLSIPSFTHKLAYVKLNSSQTLKLTGGWTGSGFLIIDGGTLDMSGGGGQTVNFTGIIWIENGDFSSISGGININGAIYINSSSTTSTTINGTSVTITYDQGVVNDMMNDFGHQTPKILCWSEVAGGC